MAKSTPIPRDRDPRAPKELQLKFRLSRELHDSIAAAADRSGRSVSQEIRRRLEIPLADNEQTSQLVEAIKLAAQTVDWHKTPGDFARFRAALDVLLRQFRPYGEIDAADAKRIAQEGAMIAGVVLGTLGLSFQVGTVEPKGQRNPANKRR